MEPIPHNFSEEQKERIFQLKLKHQFYVGKVNNATLKFKWESFSDDNNTKGTLEFYSYDLKDPPEIPKTVFYDGFMHYYNLFKKELYDIPIYVKLDLFFYIYPPRRFLGEHNMIYFRGFFNTEQKNKFLNDNSYYEMTIPESKRVLKDTIDYVPKIESDYLIKLNKKINNIDTIENFIKKGIFKNKPYELIKPDNQVNFVLIITDSDDKTNTLPITIKSNFTYFIISKTPKNWENEEDKKELLDHLNNKLSLFNGFITFSDR